jgi:hypothetical protein
LGRLEGEAFGRTVSGSKPPSGGAGQETGKLSGGSVSGEPGHLRVKRLKGDRETYERNGFKDRGAFEQTFPGGVRSALRSTAMDPASAHLTLFPVPEWRFQTKSRRNNTKKRHRRAGFSDVFVSLMDPASMHLDASLIAVARVGVNYI